MKTKLTLLLFFISSILLASEETNLIRTIKEKVYDLDNYYGKKADAIMFLNTAVYYKINKENTIQEIKLDIQNVTNNLTPVREYYNSTTNKIEYTTQLSLLPNISYRIFF